MASVKIYTAFRLTLMILEHIKSAESTGIRYKFINISHGQKEQGIPLRGYLFIFNCNEQK